jgi:hypothetical protein
LQDGPDQDESKGLHFVILFLKIYFLTKCKFPNQICKSRTQKQGAKQRFGKYGQNIENPYHDAMKWNHIND